MKLSDIPEFLSDGERVLLNYPLPPSLDFGPPLIVYIYSYWRDYDCYTYDAAEFMERFYDYCYTIMAEYYPIMKQYEKAWNIGDGVAVETINETNRVAPNGTESDLATAFNDGGRIITRTDTARDLGTRLSAFGSIPAPLLPIVKAYAPLFNKTIVLEVC
jgi:hypothetical protein